MKLISKILISSIALLLTGYLFAEPVCPPKSIIENARFVNAFPINTRDKDQWGMLTENFVIDNNNWNIALGATLENVNNPDEALQKGQAFFKTLTINNPKTIDLQGQFFCFYAYSEPNGNQFFVAASTPPLTPPDDLKKFLK